MLTITPFGAAGEVTGSNWLVEFGHDRVLIDCGLFQGESLVHHRNRDPFPYDPAAIDAVVLTHAHLDHCGRLPKLVADGFRGHIYATPVTRELTELVLRDAAALAAKPGTESDAPYTVADVDRCLERFQDIAYDQLVVLTNQLELHLVDAGHIIGSSSAVLHIGNHRIVFSGDIGNPGAAIVRDPQPIDRADVVVMEATYGNRTHTHPDHRMDEFIAAVADGVHRGGAVIVPAFSLERSQELLYSFFQWQKDRALKTVPVFLDSPMAISATDVFRRYQSNYDQEAAVLAKAGKDFFKFPMLHVTRTPDASRAIIHVANPKIIIAGSGMMTGGRVRHHLRNYLGDPRTTVIVVGYQAQGTLGRLLVDGARQVHIDDELVDVRATFVVLHSLSAHADRHDLLKWLRTIKGVQQLILGHADDDARAAFAATVRSELHLTAAQPRFGQPIHLESIGERQLVSPPAVTLPATV